MSLFANRAPEPEPDYGAAEGVLVVVRHESRPGTWSVVEYGSDTALRSYTAESAAWFHACWSRFHRDNVLPRVTDGGWFYAASGKGFTSDPRFAETVPVEGVTSEQRRQVDRAVVRFIRAKVGTMDPLEAFLSSDIAPTTLTEADGLTDDLMREIEGTDWSRGAVETPDNPSESLAGGPEGDDPSGDSEPLSGDFDAFEGPLSDPSVFYADHEREYAEDAAYRAAFNFADLAENAPSEAARAYWLEKWEGLQ